MHYFFESISWPLLAAYRHRANCLRLGSKSFWAMTKEANASQITVFPWTSGSLSLTESE